MTPNVLRVLSFDVGVRNHACCLIEWRRPANDAGSVLENWWSNVRVLTWHCVDITTTPSAAARDGDDGGDSDSDSAAAATTVAKNVTKLPMHTTLSMLMTTSDALLDEWYERHLIGGDVPLDSIVIEQQPKLNPKMKMVSAALFAWCFLKLGGGANNAAPAVTFCSPAGKGHVIEEYCRAHELEYDCSVNADGTKKRKRAAAAAAANVDQPNPKPKPKPKPKTALAAKRRAEYVVRKGESVFACSAWCNGCNDDGGGGGGDDIKIAFASSKKKDDLADAFWQAMYHLRSLLTTVAKADAKANAKTLKAAATADAKAAAKATKLKVKAEAKAAAVAAKSS